MSKIYVVVEGGCVRYISSAAVKHTAVVIDRELTPFRMILVTEY